MQVSISNDTPEPESSPHEFAAHEFAEAEFAAIEKHEQPFQSSEASKPWGITGLVMATIFFIAILVIGVSAERTLNHLVPNKPIPTSGMVIEKDITPPVATPAYPTVCVQESTDPSQAPSPLPETPVKTK